MDKNLPVVLITIIAYLIMMVVIGAVFSKKNKNVGDFYLGGRKLGPIVSAMSAEASDMSSWLLMGLPGVAYLTGGAEAGWTAIGLAIGTYLNWLIVAKRLRVYTQTCGAITIPDFFSLRFHEKKNVLMGVSALIILIFSLTGITTLQWSSVRSSLLRTLVWEASSQQVPQTLSRAL